MLATFRELWNGQSKLPPEVRLSAWFFVILAAWTAGSVVLLIVKGSATLPLYLTGLLGFPGLSDYSSSSNFNIYLFVLTLFLLGLSLFVTYGLLRLSRRGLIYGLIFCATMIAQIAFLAWQKDYPRNPADWVFLAAELAVFVYLLRDEKKFKYL